jgi:hypothetical protein
MSSPFQPTQCWTRFRTVTWREAARSATAKSGRYRRTGASRSTLPRSTNCISAVPVKVLVVEPIRKSVSPSTGTG